MWSRRKVCIPQESHVDANNIDRFLVKQQPPHMAFLWSVFGWVLLNQIWQPRYFPVFRDDQNTGYLWTITFIFARYRHSPAVMTHVKYKRGLKHPTGAVKNINILNNQRSLSNPHLWDPRTHPNNKFPLAVQLKGELHFLSFNFGGICSP